MANLAAGSILILFLFLVFFMALVSQIHGTSNHVAFFIFGDSFVDAGNNNYINTTTDDQANFLPYGETYFRFPTGRFSNGRLISDFIAEYANLPLIPPFLQPGITQFHHGANFASGGAGALDETHQGSVIPLKTQARYFKKVVVWLNLKLGSSKAKAVLSNAVYMFIIGNNDYLSSVLTGSATLRSNYSNSEYVGMVVGNVTSTIKEIYKSGARKFAFMNLPPLGSLPHIRMVDLIRGDDRYSQELSSLVSLHNQALSEVLFRLEKQLKGFKFSLYDFNLGLTQIIKNPLDYGFKDAKSACCGSGPFGGEYSCGGKRGQEHFKLCDNLNEHVFWDSFHQTENVYKQLATQMWVFNGSSHNSSIGPYTIRDLFQVK